MPGYGLNKSSKPKPVQTLITDNRHWFYLAVGLLAIWLLGLLAPILTPFVIGGLLAFLGNPLVKRLVCLGSHRNVAATLVFVLFFVLWLSVMFWLIPLLENQISDLIKRIPEYGRWLRSTMQPWLQQYIGIDDGLFNWQGMQKVLAEHWQKTGGAIKWMFVSVTKSGSAILLFLGNLFLIPVIAFYLLRDWDLMWSNLRALLPPRYEPKGVRLARESEQMLAGFLRGQLMVMLSLSLIYSIGLSLMGLQLAILIGLIAGMLSFVPYLGLILGILMASVATVLQFQSIDPVIWVLLVFTVAQLTEAAFLTPKLVGDSIGMHPVGIIFTLLAGAHLFGFFGVLAALPVASVAMVLIRFAVEQYKTSRYYRS